MAAVSCGTSHSSAVSTPLRWIFKSRGRHKKLFTHVELQASTVSLLYKGDQLQQQEKEDNWFNCQRHAPSTAVCPTEAPDVHWPLPALTTAVDTVIYRLHAWHWFCYVEWHPRTLRPKKARHWVCASVICCWRGWTMCSSVAWRHNRARVSCIPWLDHD